MKKVSHFPVEDNLGKKKGCIHLLYFLLFLSGQMKNLDIIMVKIGIISDTHGILNPLVLDKLRDVEHILHAGDIGNADIIRKLKQIAIVDAVHGNSDFYPLNLHYPSERKVLIRGKSFFLTHHFDSGRSFDRNRLSRIGPVDFVVCGHTHEFSIRQFGQTMILNPGSVSRTRVGSSGTGILLLLEEDGTYELKRIEFSEAKNGFE